MERKEFFLIALTIFITVVVWIIADIYHISTTQQVHIENKKVSKDIDFEIDVSIFDELGIRN